MLADLYLDKVDICRYWPAAGEMTCAAFQENWAAGKVRKEDYPFLTVRQWRLFKLVLEAGTYLTPVPMLTVPRPTEAGLFPLNGPGADSLVIVTGNNQYTFELLATVWSQGITPAHFLLVNCLGNTVDMAMVYGEFTPERLARAVTETGLKERVKHRHLIVPGVTEPLADEFAAATRWEIEVGPLCALELPLFLGDRWMLPAGLE
jgi:CO dehydrogenase/acetyl-CoA synthase gamma subunit (corrinoid Fe-S protein)